MVQKQSTDGQALQAMTGTRMDRMVVVVLSCRRAEDGI
jgi:hypothetical protein